MNIQILDLKIVYQICKIKEFVNVIKYSLDFQGFCHDEA